MEKKNITMNESPVKGVVIAGLSGGSGKSIVAVGLSAAWVQQGRVVAPFKKGPDYIDAGWLQCGAAHPCYNLDPYLFTEERISSSFYRRAAGADLAVVEGNRGLFDGVTATGGYSTAELAMQLGLPVLLVVNCTKMTRTVAALVKGCTAFEPELQIGGVILNQIATSRQQKIITEAVHHYTDIPVLGTVPRMKRDVFPMRHLGMVPYQEYSGTGEALEFLAATVREHIDMAGVEQMMKAVGSGTEATAAVPTTMHVSPQVRIGVIQDSAFQFYYPENLESLEKQGARLVPINALEDERLPELDGLYIGGGFPETSAARLAANQDFRQSLRSAALAGLPIYAECGGLIYLGREIIIDEKRYPLAGVFDVVFGMSSKPQAHGYSIFTAAKENPFFPVGFSTKGHEFRYSTVLEWNGSRDDLALRMDRGTGFSDGFDGLTVNNVLALYTHLHAEGTPQWAGFFVSRCDRYRTKTFALNG
jgi:cobyrinic acid a,c-diamide synthase